MDGQGIVFTHVLSIHRRPCRVVATTEHRLHHARAQPLNGHFHCIPFDCRPSYDHWSALGRPSVAGRTSGRRGRPRYVPYYSTPRCFGLALALTHSQAGRNTGGSRHGLYAAEARPGAV